MKYELEIGIAIGIVVTMLGYSILDGLRRIKLTPTAHDRWDSLLVSKLTKQGMDRNKANFKSFTQSIYGWDKDDEGNLSPNWKEQDIIQLIKEMIEDKHSYSSIARLLNNNGEKGKRGGKWTPHTIKRVSSNPFHDNINQFKRD
jgi:DNA invertase Pin-like site-specific DNA recombinase